MTDAERVIEEIREEIERCAAGMLMPPTDHGQMREDVKDTYRRVLRATWENDGVPEETIQSCLATIDVREEADGVFTARWNPPIVQVTITVESE